MTIRKKSPTDEAILSKMLTAPSVSDFVESVERMIFLYDEEYPESNPASSAVASTIGHNVVRNWSMIKATLLESKHD